MESPARYAGQELTWEPSSAAKRTYELRAGDQTLATLAQPSRWRQDRLGTSADGQWTFARVGLFRQRFVITDALSGAEAARFVASGWSGKGTLTLPDGSRYEWRKASAWGSKWAWLDEAGQPLLRFRQSGALRQQCVVMVEPQAAADTRLIFLAMFGWYLMLLSNADATAATAAATVAATS